MTTAAAVAALFVEAASAVLLKTYVNAQDGAPVLSLLHNGRSSAPIAVTRIGFMTGARLEEDIYAKCLPV